MKVLLVAGSLLLGPAITTAWLQPLPFPSPLTSISSASMPSSSFPAFSCTPLYNPTQSISTTTMSRRPRAFMLQLRASPLQQGRNDTSGTTSAGNEVPALR